MKVTEDYQDRIYKLTSLMQSERLWSTDRLAYELDVSNRSIHRYIKHLRSEGYNISSSKGAGGGIMLRKQRKAA